MNSNTCTNYEAMEREAQYREEIGKEFEWKYENLRFELEVFLRDKRLSGWFDELEEFCNKYNVDKAEYFFYLLEEAK